MKVVPMSMLRSRWAALGLFATAVLVLLAFVAPFGGGFAAFHPPGAPSSTHGGGAVATPRALVHPAAGYSVTVTVTNSYVGTATPPLWLNYTLAVAGVPLSPDNVSVALSVLAGPSSQLINTHNLPVTTGVASYTLLMDYYYIGGYLALPTSQYVFEVDATISDPNILPAGSMTNSSYLNITTLKVDNPSVSFAVPLPVYATFPIAVNFNATVAVANSGITVNAANVSVGIYFAIAHGTCIENTPYGCFAWAPTIIGNTTLPFAASGSYAVTIDSSFITDPTSGASFNDGDLPAGVYAVTPYITVWNSANAAFPQRTVQAQQTLFFTANTPSAQVLGPLNTTSGLTVGSNVTISTFYSGDFVSGATVNVYNESSTSLVYTQGVFAPGNGGHGAAVVWIPGAAGMYTIELNVTSQVAAPVVDQVVHVAIGPAPVSSGPKSIITYLNTTIWHNQTSTTQLLGGLSPGVSSSLLLVVGLVVGLVVALALGRMMWGGAKPSPAQPWSASSAKPNECSICHQSFATPQELEEHGKQAHGMT
jgi:hypothetical protein